MIPLPSLISGWVEEAAPPVQKAVRACLHRIRSTRTAAWVLLLHPNPESKVLLVVRQPSAAVFVLSRLFSGIHLLVAEKSSVLPLQQFYDQFCENIRVFHWNNAEDLASTAGYSSLLIENALMSFGVVRTRKLCELLKASSCNFQQVAIVSRNPFGLGVLRERLRLKFENKHKLRVNDEGASWRAIHNLLISAGARVINRYELYPNAAAPREILGSWGSVPQNRRGWTTRLLGKIGVMRKLHNGYFYLGTNGQQIGKTCLEGILDQIGEAWGSGHTPSINWLRCLETGSVILDLSNYDGERAILKIPFAVGSAISARKQRLSVNEFVAQYSWGSALTARQIYEGEYRGISYFLESKIKGVPGNELKLSDDCVYAMTREIAGFLHKVWESKSSTAFIDERYFEALVGEFVSRVRGSAIGQATDILELEDALRKILIGTDIPIGFAHGDLNAKNILFEPDEIKLAGIIDWDSASYDQLPLRDLIHFLVSIFRYRDKLSYGDAIVKLMSSESSNEGVMLHAFAREIGIPPNTVSAMLVICWLRYLADTLRYSHTFINDSGNRSRISREAKQLIDGLIGAVAV